MRFYERQEGETAKAFEAFKVYRDLRSNRSLARCAEIYYGARKNIAQLGIWSSRNEWVDRAHAYDDYMEMLRRDAIEEYERKHGTDLAAREASTQEELLEVKELLLPKMKAMARWPLERRLVKSGENGEDEVHIHPARWSFHTLIKAIEILDDTPDKLALTDPTGQREYGQSLDDVNRLFMEVVEATRDGEDDR